MAIEPDQNLLIQLFKTRTRDEARDVAIKIIEHFKGKPVPKETIFAELQDWRTFNDTTTTENWRLWIKADTITDNEMRLIRYSILEPLNLQYSKEELNNTTYHVIKKIIFN